MGVGGVGQHLGGVGWWVGYGGSDFVMTLILFLHPFLLLFSLPPLPGKEADRETAARFQSP